VFFCVVCVKCVLYYCHRVSTQLQLTNVSSFTSISRHSDPRHPTKCYLLPQDKMNSTKDTNPRNLAAYASYSDELHLLMVSARYNLHKVLSILHNYCAQNCAADRRQTARPSVRQNITNLKYGDLFMYAAMFHLQVTFVVIKYVKFRRSQDHVCSSGIACKKKHSNTYDTNGITNTQLPTVLH
jgi:hypothetical protein